VSETICRTAQEWRALFARRLDWTWTIEAGAVNDILMDMERLERQVGDLSARLAVALQALKECEAPTPAPSPYPEIILVPRDAR
jgi:hypothetical protein